MNLPLIFMKKVSTECNPTTGLVFFRQTLKPGCPMDMSWVVFLKDSLGECVSKVRCLDTLLANALHSRLNYGWNVPCSWPNKPLPILCLFIQVYKWVLVT